MAFYRQPCIQCNALIDRDARFCPSCGSASPFGYSCPDCLTSIAKGQALCSGCGRTLLATCPHCGQSTFTQERCERCGKTLMVPCANKRCGVPQFFQNAKCTACGKRLKR